ncbi:arylamine N-acetyltransferase family protein [Lentisalinibacter sediminis]|uniref:arylamine N-acetyltransferase family protein n=1 Tax=Lentisalinibacter sediminis TaxID=2992237 RepID=UPI00386CF981
MHLQPYLDRIGYPGPVTPTLATLRALLRHHALAVPFENLDVQLGRRLTLDPGAAFDKIVHNKRGGWCYEQNGLFGAVLATIGFGVTRIAGAVMREGREDISAANHLALLIETEDAPGRRFLADVGFGGSLLEPIELAETTHSQPPFHLGLRRLAHGHWQFHEDAGEGEFTFDFESVPGDEDALARRCDYLQSDPTSGFVRSLVAQIRLPDAHRTLRGRVLSEIGPRGSEERLIDSADDLLHTLARQFHLDVPEVRDLWPRIVERHEEFMRGQAADDQRPND